MAWSGAVTEQGAGFAVADLNAGGGVLGEQIEMITADARSLLRFMQRNLGVMNSHRQQILRELSCSSDEGS